jgi:hypothetical protein
MIKSIKLRDVKDIQTVNDIVTKYPYDIWIHSKSGMADAKSILGMYILKLNEPLTLVIPDDVNPKDLFEELSEFLEIG